MNEQEKQDVEIARGQREGSMTEMEAAARLFALQDRLRAGKVDRSRLAPKMYRVDDLPALRTFVNNAVAEGAKEPPNASWRFPVGSPNTLLKKT